MVAQTVKNPPAIQETLVKPLVWEDPQEKGMAVYSFFKKIHFKKVWVIALTCLISRNIFPIYKVILRESACVLCMLSHFHCVQFSGTLWRVARHALLSMGFSRQEYWIG